MVAISPTRSTNLDTHKVTIRNQGSFYEMAILEKLDGGGN